MRAMADQDRVRRYGNSVCGCELRRVRRRVVGLSMGICMPSLFQECARACARVPTIAVRSFRSSPCCSLRSAHLPPHRRSPARRPPPRKVGVWYNFVATASDADGDALKFSILNKPSLGGVQHDQRPAVGHADQRQHRHVLEHHHQVSDGTATASLPAFSITVTGATGTNRAPKISGTPPTTAKVGVWYNFRATASDPERRPAQVLDPEQAVVAGRSTRRTAGCRPRRPAPTSARIRTSSSA